MAVFTLTNNDNANNPPDQRRVGLLGFAIQ
jgi:hypothetical protein